LQQVFPQLLDEKPLYRLPWKREGWYGACHSCAGQNAPRHILTKPFAHLKDFLKEWPRDDFQALPQRPLARTPCGVLLALRWPL
jgi:hypothetical protein